MSSEKRDFKFDKKANAYDEGFEGKASQKFYNILLREMSLTPDAIVLDVGCGTGALLGLLSNACHIEGIGIDAEENMIEVARTKYPKMSFHISSCDDIPLNDSSVDVLVACMAYHHFNNREGFAKEAYRLLKQEGVLYIADPHFPWIIRKAINGFARITRIEGEFLSSDEITARFNGYGFNCLGSAFDGYAQVVKLQKY